MSGEDWERAAGDWIAAIGERGDWARTDIIDPALVPHFEAETFHRALDVGCGEGRLCRRLAALGVVATGIDPAPSLVERARALHPGGDYQTGKAETLPFARGSFDLVVSCLSLIDIPDIDAAIAEMARVLAPNGVLLVVNLTSFNTAAGDKGWRKDAFGRKLDYPVDNYLTERAYEMTRPVRATNHHRPLSRYMQSFLAQQLMLEAFEEPRPIKPAHPRAADYCRAPWFHLMKWRKRS